MKMVNLRRPPAGVNLQGASFIGGMADVNDHVARVAAGGGTGANESDLFKIYRFLHSHGLLSGTKLLWTPEAGYVHRFDGVLKYCRTSFDTSLYDNDLDGSATASKQPRLVGGIAPNSKPAASNQTGESRKFTHATITVTGTYTVVKMLNTTGKYVNTYTEVVGGTITECTWTGGMRLYMVYAGVLSAGQRDLIDAFVLTLYPEIESVVIGTQTWATRNFEAVATPLGNVIPEVQTAGAVEKITNAADREFSSDTGWWFTMLGFTIANGVCNVNSNSNYSISKSILTIGKYYKVTFTIINKTGNPTYGVRLNKSTSPTTDGININTLFSADGTYTVFGKAQSSVFGFFSYGVSGQYSLDIDNVSIQELNWSNATEIYNAVYAATSGTTAEKEYDALKEAAMWCYYNNDPANGAIYGKLYNWYAAKLLDLDMVTAGFGWRVPTSAQFTTLTNALGGVSVAGGKMKMTGTDYWKTPNTGATNESGFTFLPSGGRSNTGTFGFINIYGISWSSDSINVSTGKVITCYNLDDDLLIQNDEKLRGMQIRLIKD